MFFFEKAEKVLKSMKNLKDKLWTSSFISACIGNFLLFFAFYLLVPIFPLYLIAEFQMSTSLVGVILATYTLAALLIRPLSGFVLDMFNRKPIYLAAYFLFVITFIGYPLVHLIGFFLVVRILHGFTFGFVTTAANSLIVDIMPASRRGEGFGYFGVANNLAMALGPMVGLFVLDVYNFDFVFYIAIVSGLIGFMISTNIKSDKKVAKSIKQPIAFDRFFLAKGLSPGFCLFLMGIPYGMIVTYVAIYGKTIGIQSGVGFFFSLMAFGIIWSRILAGKMVDSGRLVQVIAYGTFICLLAVLMLSSIPKLTQFHGLVIVSAFYALALVLGIGYGMIFPAYNTLFVNLAPHNRRATASSTYMTSWDLGIGLGLILGGRISDTKLGLPFAYFVGAMGILLSFVVFYTIVGPYFEKNKLR